MRVLPVACVPAGCDLRPARSAARPVPVQQCRVWVPEVCEKQIECVKYVRETCVKKVPYTVCQMVPEQRVKTCTYKVCHDGEGSLREADPLHGVQDGARAAREDLHLPGLPDGARAAREDLHLHRSARWCPSSA